jgi:hypothetical protein
MHPDKAVQLAMQDLPRPRLHAESAEPVIDAALLPPAIGAER